MADPVRERSRGWALAALLCVTLLVAGGGLVWWIFSTEPVAVQEGATRETAMLVETIRPEAGTFRPTIEAMGTVRASQRIVLRPRVGGQVLEISERFVPGATVGKDEWIVRLDPADYENAVRLRRSDLREAEAELRIEMGQQNVAEKEFELFGGELADESRSLMLREPQLERAKARVEAARAALDLALLEEERTRIVAPFDAQILTRHVDVGSQVAAGDPLATLVGLDTYWVETMVPLSRLRWLPRQADAAGEAAVVRLRDRTAWPEGVHRTGKIDQVVGELEERSRLARVLVAVDDPLARHLADAPPLVIGTYLEVRLPCEPLRDVVRLEREYLRNGDTVWVMDEDRLAIRPVEVVFLDAEHAYIAGGLAPGDDVVITNLATIVEGAPLRRREAAPPSPGEAPEE